MLHYYDLDVSQVFIHENFLINQIREGQAIHPEHVEILRELVERHFKVRPMIYLSNRIHSYAVNPITYTYLPTIKNLIAIGIVATTKESREAAQFEKSFFDKPFKIFNNLTDAISWSHKILST